MWRQQWHARAGRPWSANDQAEIQRVADCESACNIISGLLPHDVPVVVGLYKNAQKLGRSGLEVPGRCRTCLHAQPEAQQCTNAQQRCSSCKRSETLLPGFIKKLTLSLSKLDPEMFTTLHGQE